MTVYVDDMRRPATVGHIKARWSHLFADTTEELVEFARRLGLRDEWLQHGATHREHYDVTDKVRDRALALGAQELSYPRGTGAYISQKRRPQDHPQADGGTPAAAGGSGPEQDVPPSDGGAKEPGDPTPRAASEAHAPPSTPAQVIAQANLEYRLAEALHDRRCAYGTACHDRAAHIMRPHGEDARALAPFVAELLAEQSDTATPTTSDGSSRPAVDASSQQHVYLSTACLHGECAYCECRTGITGEQTGDRL